MSAKITLMEFMNNFDSLVTKELWDKCENISEEREKEVRKKITEEKESNNSES